MKCYEQSLLGVTEFIADCDDLYRDTRNAVLGGTVDEVREGIVERQNAIGEASLVLLDFDKDGGIEHDTSTGSLYLRFMQAGLRLRVIDLMLVGVMDKQIHQSAAAGDA